ncbi:UDP-N-acetylmuramyl pentapeptide phosphotransferase/UDP-N-acetylglucosamine-1-phosphate transferase [Algibacter lectus]|nr:UDP-N-acetylmuramyl pentapeptide phosphotransferase/UDP-N-acetylglucosamine-1-phosphate transferase [Algibacter lectus]
MQDPLSSLIFLSIISAIFSFGLVSYIIPKIIFMVNFHNLNEVPGERSSHTRATPTMGGLAFFVTLVLNLFLFKPVDTEYIGLNLAAAITIIFIVGLKDDLAVSTPRARVIVEIFAICIVFLHSDFHTTSLAGFMGIHEVPTVVLDVLHVIIALTIINAYNLIDGVDGLASTLGISIFSMFGLIFLTMGLNYYFLICVSLICVLLAFMRYNFSHEKKIFMGDTGSLVIGFCIAILALKFLTIDTSLFKRFTFAPQNKLLIVAAILAVPLFDMMRVIGVRLLKKQSPFTADRNHIHHILSDLGLEHYKIAILLGLLNYTLAIILIFFASIFNSFQMMFILPIIFILLLGIFHKLKLLSLKKINN